MRLTVLGSSGGCPSRGNPASGYLISTGATNVWLEAGPGTFAALADRVDPGILDAVVVSHRHVDHCVDLVGLFGYLAYGPSGRIPMRVYAPDGVADRLAAVLGADEDHLFFQVFEFMGVGGGDQVELGDLSVAFAMTEHNVPTVAARFDHGGRSLAFSADTGRGGGFPELAREADVVLCEATFRGPAEASPMPHHLTAGDAGVIAAEARAGALFVTHVSPTLDPVESVEDAAATFAREVGWAAPGRVIEI